MDDKIMHPSIYPVKIPPLVFLQNMLRVGYFRHIKLFYV